MSRNFLKFFNPPFSSSSRKMDKYDATHICMERHVFLQPPLLPHECVVICEQPL